MSRFAALVPALLASLALAVVPASAQASFGLLPGPAGFDVAAQESNGNPTSLAGAHPYELNVRIAFNLDSGGFSEGDVKDIFLEYPPGLIENPTAVPKCEEDEFETPRSSPYETSRSGESCPDESQIGVASLETDAGTRSFGIFNLEPPPGYPSRFGFAPFRAPVSFIPHIRQGDGEYRLALASRNFTQLFDASALELTFWGTPWASAHNGERGNCLNEVAPGTPHGQCPVSLIDQPHGTWPYLTLPSDCSGPLEFSIAADSWESPGSYRADGEPDLGTGGWRTASSQSAGALQDCPGLGFFSSITTTPTTALVSSPTGLAFTLGTNQAGLLSAGGRLSSRMKRATVALPEGMTINPSIGEGLRGCSEAQFAAESATSAPGTGCPNPSKIGAGTVETPLVEGLLKGSLFIATPFANPFGSPYALYFVAKSAERGFIVKVPGRLDADPTTGQLTATFDNLPQLPYTQLKIDFREGQRAPLVSPAACGTYRSNIVLNPWIDPGIVLQQSSNFSIVRGITPGGACPTGGAPFQPQARAGSLNSFAGAYTPFYLHLTRTDVDQELTSYSAQLPPGLLGKIAGIPFCPDAAIEAAKGRLGAVENGAPSCPAASEIGHTYTAFGVGLAPAYSPGRFYLAGPYNGSPLSVVLINPAIVGPFDLGTIVMRSAIRVDPKNAQVTIDSGASDPIPHIYAGIPLRVRDVRVYIDRPDFMVNPTNCSPFTIVSILTGSDAPFTNPKSATAQAPSRYQNFDCSSLKYSPRFALKLKGPVKRGDYPTLKAVVTPRPGHANMASAAVTLPPSLFLAQEHIEGVCTRVQFRADACPPQSMIGRARAVTPLLSGPMEGPVYLRSSDNPLPDLVTVLHGSGIRIVLEGIIDSHRDGIRARFYGLPDAPVSKFTMTIFGGRKRGILAAADNLCRHVPIGEARFIGQSNLGVAQKPVVRAKCKKKRKHAKRKARR